MKSCEQPECNVMRAEYELRSGALTMHLCPQHADLQKAELDAAGRPVYLNRIAAPPKMRGTVEDTESSQLVKTPSSDEG